MPRMRQRTCNVELKLTTFNILYFELGWISEGDSKELSVSTGPKSRGPSVNTLMDIVNTSDLCLLC